MYMKVIFIINDLLTIIIIIIPQNSVFNTVNAFRNKSYNFGKASQLNISSVILISSFLFLL